MPFLQCQPEEEARRDQKGRCKKKRESEHTLTSWSSFPLSLLPSLHSFNFLNVDSFHPWAFVYAVFSVQNGLSALLGGDSFSPVRVHLEWSLVRKAFLVATWSRDPPSLSFPMLLCVDSVSLLFVTSPHGTVSHVVCLWLFLQCLASDKYFYVYLSI